MGFKVKLEWQTYLYDFCTNLWKSNFTQNLYKLMKLNKFVMNRYMIIISIQNVSNFHLICVNDSLNSPWYFYYPKVHIQYITNLPSFTCLYNVMRKLIFISSYKFCTNVSVHKFAQKLYEFCVMVNMNIMFTYSIS